jgi:hypothetical protein
MTLSGVGTDSSIEDRGVTSVELTIGTKTLAAAFFVADVEGNYSLILGRDKVLMASPRRPSGRSFWASSSPRLGCVWRRRARLGVA